MFVSGSLLVCSVGFGQAQEGLAVVAQLFDALQDVVQRAVRAFFAEAFVGGGMPAAGELFEGGYVEVAVVEPGFQAGHVAPHEAAVLVHGVATQGAGALRNPLRHEIEQALLHFGFGKRRIFHALGEAGAFVGAGVPGIHAFEQFVALVDGVGFGLGEDV